VKRVPFLLIMVAILVVAAVSWSVIRKHIPSDIEYQGQKIRLTKHYPSFEDYKDDPDNIDPSENERVARLVIAAPIDPQFTDEREMTRAIIEIKFPGYGLGLLGETPQPDGSALAMFSIEVPRADKNRYLVFSKLNHSYTLVDDFVESEVPEFWKVRMVDNALIYTSRKGERTLTRPITKKFP
jgi:hypothetical protein